MATRGAKVGIVLTVLAVVLLGVLVVADRVAAGVAEDKISQQVKSELDNRQVKIDNVPHVDITGFPFLTQVLGGEYRKISIVLDRPNLDGFQLSDLRIDANTVHADTRAVMNGTGEVVADEVVGTANIPWDSVRKQLEVAGVPDGVDLEAVQLNVINNEAEVRVPLVVQNFKVTIIAKGTVIVDTGKLKLQLKDVTTDLGELPQVVQNQIKRYQQNLAVAINIPALPFSLTINKVQTNEQGLQIVASGRDVSLADAA